MTRASERQGAYRGRVGTTCKERVHYTCADGRVVSVEVVRSIDARRDPELAERLLASEPGRALNTVECGDSEPARVEVPTIYHDPVREIFALVLPPSARARELRERAALYGALADDVEVPVPDYVRDFAVVYGADGLRRHLAERDVTEGAADDDARREAQLAERERRVAAREAELARQSESLSRREQHLERRDAELEETTDPSRESDRPPPEKRRRTRDTEDELETSVSHDTMRVRAPSAAEDRGAESDETNPLPRIEPEEIETGQVMELSAEGEPAGGEGKTAVLRVDGSTQVGGERDQAIERWMVSREPTLKLLDDAGTVRLAASCAAGELEDLLAERVEVRLQLHRLPTYPLVTLAIATRASFEGGRGAVEPLLFRFDVGREDDRAILKALEARFSFTLELFDSQYLAVRKRSVTASLGENIGYLLAAAAEHLDTLSAPQRNYNRAVLAHAAPDYDRFGRRHPERKEFRDDKLQALATPAQVRRALAVARRFSAPAHEEYLILTRSYPLKVWLRRRRRLLERALEVGLWTGPTLASLAVSEGLVSSRKELVQRLQHGFAATVEGHACDLDEEAVRDNWNELGSEASALGLTTGERGRPRSTPIYSDGEPVASGVIGADSAGQADGLGHPTRRDLRPLGETEILVAGLEDKDRRLEAALKLCARGEVAALPALFSCIERMTRGEAGRVLGAVVQYGEGAVSQLIEALGSRKGFIRQGAALALGVIKDERGVEAICDLLVSEPTEIWKEIARAIGEVGPGAVMSLASRLGGAPEAKRERVAWALAHVINHGGRGPVETLSAGRDPIAAGVARHALELAELAQSDDVAVRGQRPPRDQTVNRAFSRRFFEALGRGGGEPVAVAPETDMSGPAMVLDESDLLEAGDLEDGAG